MSSVIPHRVSELIDTDRASPDRAARYMTDLDPWMLGAFDETDALFEILRQKVGTWPRWADGTNALMAGAVSEGLSDEELAGRLWKSEIQGLRAATITAYQRLLALHSIMVLAMACERYWAWGAGELFRLRLGPAQGYLRLQAESVGLMMLFLDDPSVAERWRRIQTPKTGKEFFRSTQPRLVPIIKTLHLFDAYSMVSGVAQHVRMAGMVRSLRWSEDGSISLADLDFSEENLSGFHEVVFNFHKTQLLIVEAAKAVVSVDDELWDQAVAAFGANVARLKQVVGKRYATEFTEQ